MPREGAVIGYVNIFNYLSWRRHPELVQGFDYFTLDGIMLSVFIRIFYGKHIERKSPDFSSYFQELFERFESENLSVYFVGGSNDEVLAAREVIAQAFPGLVIAGIHSGYYDDNTPVIEEIIKSEAHICIAGMGTPRQEQFLLALKRSKFQGRSFSCGAFISQTANGGKSYYPKWVNRLHLRWLYRIYREPKLIRRYTVDYPIGLYYLLADKNSKTD